MSGYTLREHLRRQMKSSFRSLEAAIKGVTEVQAREGARADWRRYRWGSGLDGSIAGIVTHAALWKHLFAAGLESGSFPAEESLAPPGRGWEALRKWLGAGERRLEAAFEQLDDAALEEERQWEGMTAPLARLLSYVIEHDLYHAGQIELLRQLRGYPSHAD